MEIALLYRIIFIMFIIMGLYLMKLGCNWERKVPHKYMVIRTFKILYRIWLVREVRR